MELDFSFWHSDHVCFFASDSVSSLDCVSSDDGVINELERKGRKLLQANFKVLFQHLSGGTKETMGKLQSG
jgi:hypothetical protein